MEFWKKTWVFGGVLAGLVVATNQASAQESLRLEQGADGVSALAGQEVRWTFRTGEQKHSEKAAPIQVGDTVVFCGGGQLYEATAATGQIQRRMVLPGHCATLAARPDGYEVSAEGGHGQQRWKHAVTLAPGKGDPGTVLPSEITVLLSLKRQADAVTGKTKEQQEGALERLEQQRKQDPTNPWYSLRRAELLQAGGKHEEAKKAAEEALALEPRYDKDLLQLSARLQKISPDLGEQAFRRGMKALLSQGYEPELSTSLLLPMVLLGRPGDRQGGDPAPMDPVKDREALELYGERLAELAPNAEGSTWFFAALEQAAQQRKDEEKARRWGPLAHRTKGSESFLPTGPEGRNVGLYVQLAAALSIALLAGAVIKSIRSFSRRHEDGAPWWKRFNPFSRWDRGELLGFLLAALVMTGVSYRATTGVAIIGAVASAPLSLAMGDPGHPECRAYLRASPDGPGTRLLRAFAAHKAGDLEEAKKLYQQSDSAVALANLGAIAHAQGHQEQAQQLWQQATQRQPGLDAVEYNLHMRSTNDRVHLARRYQLPVLLALPTEEDWHRFWVERTRGTSSSNPLHLPNLLDGIQSDQDASLPSFYVITILDLLLLGLVLLALFAPRQLRPSSRTFGLAGASLSLLAPGAARVYGFSGFFVGAAAIFLGMGRQILESTKGQSVTILGSLAAMDWQRAYGVALVQPELPMLHGAMRFWWVGLALNAALVLAFDWRRALLAPKRP